MNKASLARWLKYSKKIFRTFPVGQVFVYLSAHLSGRSLLKVHPRNFPSGVWLRPRSTDIRVLYEIFTTRELEMEWPFESPPQTIIDGGANVGYATLAMCRRWKDCSLISVEPDQDNVAVLLKNVKSLGNVKIIRRGIWGFPCELRVEPSSLKSGAWGLRFEPVPKDSTEMGISSVSIPWLLDQLPGGRCDLLKLDVEGAEISIFSQPELDWIDRVSVILVETHGPEADRLVRAVAERFEMNIKEVGEKIMLWRDGK